jgi:hypothetical protein
VIAWHMLSRGEDYAFARPSLTREKIRKLELATGAERQKRRRIGVFATKEQHDLDKQLAARAELAYRRLVRDWQPAINGTGAARGAHLVGRQAAKQRGGRQPHPCALARGHPPALRRWRDARGA